MKTDAPPPDSARAGLLEAPAPPFPPLPVPHKQFREKGKGRSGQENSMQGGAGGGQEEAGPLVGNEPGLE